MMITAVPSVNNVSIIADYTLPNGNEVFVISEVLFVSEAIVSRLHQVRGEITIHVYINVQLRSIIPISDAQR